MARCCRVSDLFVALGHALTGERLAPAPGVDRQPLTAPVVVAGLAAVGWDAGRLRQHRTDCQVGRNPWPHPVPSDVVVPWGQFGSLLLQVRRELGLDGLHPTVHHGQKVLGPAERRLLADKPPHHG